MKIKSIITLGTAMTALPFTAQAAQMSLDIKMKSYGGLGAYAVAYVTDAKGKYVGTLHMAGGKSKYYRSLSGWTRASGGSKSEIAGITGASVGSGKTLSINFDLKDAFINSGYKIHIDSSVEDMGDAPNDIVIPITKDAVGKAIKGKGFINTATITF